MSEFDFENNFPKRDINNNQNNMQNINEPKINNVNNKRFKQEIEQKKGFKLKGSYQTRIIAGTITVALILGLGGVLIKKFTTPYTLPDNYKEVVYTEEIGRNDTVYSVIDNYYQENDNMYQKYYKGENGYKEKVLDLNNLERHDTVNYYGEIDLPVILDVNSEEYRLYQEINNLKQEKKSKDFYVDYEVKEGDIISNLAKIAAFDDNELIEYTKQIMAINGINKGDVLKVGSIIKIKNPELYEVSQRLYNAIEQFENMVKTETKSK